MFLTQESEGLSQMPAIISLLKQSSCLGSDMAPYILSIIYNYGFSARMDETQVKNLCTWQILYII